MRLLLDTHTLFWWYESHPSLSTRARDAMGDAGNEVYVSAVSAWELAIKANRMQAPRFLDAFHRDLADSGFRELPISVNHALRAGALPEHHRDPFDRMLIAQAQAEELTILSNDRMFDHYGVRRVW